MILQAQLCNFAQRDFSMVFPCNFFQNIPKWLFTEHLHITASVHKTVFQQKGLFFFVNLYVSLVYLYINLYEQLIVCVFLKTK